MSQCKWCDKKGFFLRLSVNGLCLDCDNKIVPQIYKFGEQYKKAQKKLNNFLLPKEGIALIDEIKKSLFNLYEFERKEIPTISPLPSELLEIEIYTKKNDTLAGLEERLKNEIEHGIVSFDNIFISGSGVTIGGTFIYDSRTNTFSQINTKIYESFTKWIRYHKIVIQFSKNVDIGIYREYYKSGKLRREIPFIIDIESGNFNSHGVDRGYYEDRDSEGNDTYTILDETQYQNGEAIGLRKTYSIDGGLMKEENYDKESESLDGSFVRKDYYPETGNLKFEQYKDWGKGYYDNGNLWLEDNKDWGKEYYENGAIMAEWNNKDYMKFGYYIVYYENGEVKMKCKYLDGVNRDGLMHKYFEDGKLKELWSYEKGKRKFVNKYFENGELKTEWLYDKNGNEISKKYYDKQGHLIKK